jgi:hypothetical protein
MSQMGMGGGPSVVQYGATHTLARPKTPTRNENRTLVTARNMFCVLHSCRPARSTLDLSHEPRLPPRPTPTLPHAPHDPLASKVRAAPPLGTRPTASGVRPPRRLSASGSPTTFLAAPAPALGGLATPHCCLGNCSMVGEKRGKKKVVQKVIF